MLELERNDFIAVQPVWCHEGCLFFIRLEHGDLLVSRENVYKGKDSMPDDGINYLIYLG